MSFVTKKRALYVAAESTYDTNPDADGSDYLYVPCLTLGDIVDGFEHLPTDYQTGRGFPTAPEAGVDRWTLEFSVPLYGMSDYAETGAAASATSDDFLDTLLNHVFGTRTSTSGVGLTSGVAAAGTIVADTSGLALQQLICATDTSAVRGQWYQVSAVGAAPTYSVVPNVQATIGGTWESVGTKVWQPTLPLTSSLAFYYLMDTQWYILTGGKITSAKITADVGKLLTLQVSVRGCTKATTSAPGSIPAATVPAYSPLSLRSCAVYHGTSLVDTASIEVDFGLTTAEIVASEGAQGRSGDETVGYAPKVTVRPLFSTTLQALKRNVTKAPLILGLGTGVRVSTRVYGMGVMLNEAVVTDSNPSDADGRLRDTLVFTATDQVQYSAGVAARFFTLARA